MSWTTKQLEKHKIHKMIQQAMNSPEYKEARKQDMQQATLRGLSTFALNGCLYLEMVFRCKKPGLKKFLKFVKDTTVEIGDDVDYIKDTNKYFIEKYGLDVMNELGLEFNKAIEERVEECIQRGV